MATELASLAEPPADARMSETAREQGSIGAGIVLRDVVKTYGDFRAADSISLDIRPGEFITLLGPSGSDAADPKISGSWANNPKNLAQAIEWSPDYWGAPSPDGRATNEEHGQEKLNALLAK